MFLCSKIVPKALIITANSSWGHIHMDSVYSHSHNNSRVLGGTVP